MSRLTRQAAEHHWQPGSTSAPDLAPDTPPPSRWIQACGAALQQHDVHTCSPRGEAHRMNTELCSTRSSRARLLKEHAGRSKWFITALSCAQLAHVQPEQVRGKRGTWGRPGAPPPLCRPAWSRDAWWPPQSPPCRLRAPPADTQMT